MISFVFFLFISIIIFICLGLKKLDFFNPLIFFSAMFILFYIAPGFIISTGLYDTEFYFVYEAYMFTSLLVCIVFYFVFLVSTFLGLYTSSHIKLLPRYEDPFNNFVFIFSFMLIVLSVMAKLYLYFNGLFFIEDRFSDAIRAPAVILFLNNIHLSAMAFVFIGYIFKSRYDLKTQKFITFLFFFVFFYAVMISLMQGRRFGVVFPFMIFFFLLYYYGKIRFSVQNLVKYSFFVFIIFMFVTLIRIAQLAAFEQDANSDFFDVLYYLFNNLNIVFLSALESLIGRVGNSFIMVNNVAYFQNEYAWFASFDTFKQIMSSIVPRVFWPDKPEVSIGNIFGRELFLLNQLNYITKINPGWVGEFYYNGPMDLLVGAAFIGCISSFYYGYFLKGHSMLSGVMLINYFIFIFSGIQMEVAFSVNALIKSTILFLLVFYLAKLASLLLKRRHT